MLKTVAVSVKASNQDQSWCTAFPMGHPSGQCRAHRTYPEVVAAK